MSETPTIPFRDLDSALWWLFQLQKNLYQTQGYMCDITSEWAALEHALDQVDEVKILLMASMEQFCAQTGVDMDNLKSMELWSGRGQ